MKHRLLLIGFVCIGAAASPAMAQEVTGLQAAVAIEQAMVDAIAKCGNSVVAVARTRKGLGARLLEPDTIPHEFASGVIVGENGLVLTSYHALGNPERSDYAVWHRRKAYPATIKAADPTYDLAVLQIEADSLPEMPLGKASDLKKGQVVIALGNPLATARDGEPSASWGIISNLQRKAAPRPDAELDKGRKETLHQYGTLIQTDTRLYRGTSGGALINLKGEMVGLTIAAGALPDSDEVAGFAIPVGDTFRHVVQQLKLGRSVAYGFLGVAPDELFQPAEGPGVRLANVVRGTPAAHQGLRIGDLLTHINDDPIYGMDDLMLHVGKHPPGKRVSLRVRRGGRPQMLRVTLAKKFQRTLRPAIVTDPPPRWRGMVVDYSTAHPRVAEISHDADPDGCVVAVDVATDSPAWEAGIRSGTFISHVVSTRVTTPGEFHAAVAKLGDMGAVKLQPSSQFNRTPAVTVRAASRN